LNQCAIEMIVANIKQISDSSERSDVVKKVWLCALVVFCLAVYHSHAQIQWDAEKFMPLSDVKQGMTGKGYTVFSGIEVEEFDFEVVSVEYNYFPGWHVVWCKGLSDNFKRTGVAGGMSGSPIYIDGRLIGALSLGHFNQREHANLFGVTPIESMIKVAQRGMEPNLSYQGTQLFDFGAAAAVQASGLDMGASLLRDGKVSQVPRSFDEVWFENMSRTSSQARSAQLSIPLAMPPLNPELMRYVKPIFDKFDFTPVQAAGGGGRIKESPVEEGQIIGTEYVRGDVSFFGYGTITYVKDDELLAYGHGTPSAEGNVNLPLSGGYVHFIMPSRSRSSKIAAPTQLVGTLVQDRETSIAGIIGKHPSYIPVNVNVQTTDGKRHEKYYEVIRDRGVSGLYVGVGASYLLDALEFYFHDYTVNLNATITLKEHPDLTTRELAYKNVFSSSGSPASGIMQTVMSPIMLLDSNTYTKVQVEGVNLDIKVEDKRRTARVISLQVDKLRYRPGDTVAVEITLQPYLEMPVALTGTITIPKDTPDGLVMLLASNGSFYESWQRSRAPFNFRYRDINQLVELLKREENNSNIILELSVPQPGLTVQGQEFSNLPPSVMSVMNTAKQVVGNSGYTAGTALHVDKLSTDYVVFGSGIIRFVVDRNAE
ncbi:hypothetical protein F4X90_21945, partial [Candidatus Poribacteria bacterium]|nr:hypothetical protein [Candidatus Poribacteria bacterium]